MTFGQVAAYLEHAAAESVDEYDHLVLEILAPVLLSQPGLIARAVVVAIETGHGDELAAALAEYTAERARIDKEASNDES
jgi:hypothetical protein